MTDQRTGSCGCQAVRFTLNGRIRNVANCHCSRCRKLNGAPFSSYAVVAEEDLQVVAGAEDLACFELPSGARRYFCRHCGSPVCNSNPVYPGFRMVHLGTLDAPQELLPRMNIYCSTMLGWVPRITEFPSFPGPFER